MDKHENVLFYLIGIVTTTAIWYLLGAFITMNLTWIIDSTIGRLVAAILMILTLYANLKEL